MIVEKNVDISVYTTLGIGGTAKNFYRPQHLEQLKDLTKSLEKFRILGGGSNLLVDDQSEFDHVIYMGDYHQDLLTINESRVITASSAICIKNLLNFANQHALGGAEYLHALPAMVGGVVAMNAGRGEGYNKSISDYILSVDVIYKGKIQTLSKHACAFSFRKSNLVENNMIIHAVKFKFEEVSIEEGRRRLNERIKYARKEQALAHQSAGSVFKRANFKLLKIIRYLPKNKKGLYYSEKTLNWISNGGDGTYKQAIRLIKKAIIIHRIFGKKIELEWVVWNNDGLESMK